MRRRTVLQAAVGTAMACCGLPFSSARAATAQDRKRRPRIAAVVTEYRENSHADVIVTKMLEGCRTLDVDYQTRVEIVSLYLDQRPQNDMGVDMARRHELLLAKDIRTALTLGTDRLAVDGVLLIGEHGQYPINEYEQKEYPRRRFFEEAAAVVREAKRPVPMFNDKHLSWNWQDAKYMYDTARELKIPFMAGSSIPVSWRKPDVQLPRGTELEDALVVAYGGVEIYGFHALEGLQCVVERRRGGETGVESVQCLRGAAVWDAADRGVWRWELMHQALSRSEVPKVANASREEVRAAVQDPHAFIIRYHDGLRGTVLMLNGLTREFLVAAQPKGGKPPMSVLFWLQDGKPFGHFARLSMEIEKMFLTGQPSYPVERTLLTTGVLDAAMKSRFHGGKRRETPELRVRYAAK